MTPLLTPTEALDRLAGGLDDTAFVGSGGVGDGDGLPLLAVALTDDPADAVWLDRVAALLRTAPVVTVGVVVGDGPLPGYATELDALLCDRLDPPRPWVGAPDGALAEIGRLSAAVAEAPQAATALVQLLHVGEPLAAVDAVVAESFVYSLLQAGEHHRAWLAARAVRDRRPRPDGPVVRVERRAGTLALTLDRVEVWPSPSSTPPSSGSSCEAPAPPSAAAATSTSSAPPPTPSAPTGCARPAAPGSTSPGSPIG
jgi:hypothetical protein